VSLTLTAGQDHGNKYVTSPPEMETISHTEQQVYKMCNS